MSNGYDVNLAGSTIPFQDPFLPFDLFAGEMPIITDTATISGPSGKHVRFEVLGKVTATGELVKAVRTASDGSQNPVGILAAPVDATAGDAVGPIYVGGFFNHKALVWDASFDTYERRKAAFAGLQTIRIGEVIFSGKASLPPTAEPTP